ncbi:helicase associated domain protein [Mycobacterium xenopi 4042]|uniref:Helicase associated domain protein n=1 Tax=Mycobacterium xenopi 4042 TaxID=1299334 RepID=X8DCF8_MYCXE|nr:helicase associated domain protein [Mycobacterium xenopi 4042]
MVDVGGGLAADAVLAALQVETLRLLSPGWDFGLEQLHAYAEEHGHTRVPASYVTESGYPLGPGCVGSGAAAASSPANGSPRWIPPRLGVESARGGLGRRVRQAGGLRRRAWPHPHPARPPLL